MTQNNDSTGNRRRLQQNVDTGFVGLPGLKGKGITNRDMIEKLRNPGLRWETGDFDLPNQNPNPLFDTSMETQRDPNQNQRPTQTDTEPEEPEKPIGGPIEIRQPDEINEENIMSPNNSTSGAFDNSGSRSRGSRNTRNGNRNNRGRSSSRRSGNDRQVVTNTDATTTSAFGISSPTNPIFFTSARSDNWWSNPIGPQNFNTDENSSRSAFTVIQPVFDKNDTPDPDDPRTNYYLDRPKIYDFDDQSRMEGAFTRYFSDIKSEMTVNTNASVTVSKVMFKSNFKIYQQLALALVAALAEIIARQQWEPEFTESNLVHREIKNLVTTNIPLMKARNRAQDALALMAVPSDIISYYQWLFQVYKKSDVVGGVTHTFISPEMAADLNYVQNQVSGSTFERTIEKLNWLVDEINYYNDKQAAYSAVATTPAQIAATYGSFTQMTSLLLNKTDFPFVNPRHKITASEKPIFNKEMNAVVDNFVVYTAQVENADRIYKLYPHPTEDSPTVALPFDPKDVPCLVGAHLLLGFGAAYYNTAGFPWFKAGAPGMVDGYTSTFIAITSTSAPGFNFKFDLRRGSSLQITNHIFQYADGIYDQDGSATGIIIPKGDNVRRYQLSDDNAVLDCVKMFYEQVGVRSGY
jgi:hypothetical protein